VLARRRGGLEGGLGTTVTVADLFRVPPGTGSMREGLGRPTGTNPGAEEHEALPSGERS